ncbi:hypothetical protein M407DRAFT_7062 [Tulasnella calospora MUT 4182]|uniref:Uncharacterized protein n=1 Tax=Tulasnella calospora MUT 4182 TaxID=1051891 RepID=A0A0C3QKN5_9AGAM|nr:hypothetical protein M407DRAFT_7062 [Tulasnella calospora MUT 4182]
MTIAYKEDARPTDPLYTSSTKQKDKMFCFNFLAPDGFKIELTQNATRSVSTVVTNTGRTASIRTSGASPGQTALRGDDDNAVDEDEDAPVTLEPSTQEQICRVRSVNCVVSRRNSIDEVSMGDHQYGQYSQTSTVSDIFLLAVAVV